MDKDTISSWKKIDLPFFLSRYQRLFSSFSPKFISSEPPEWLSQLGIWGRSKVMGTLSSLLGLCLGPVLLALPGKAPVTWGSAPAPCRPLTRIATHGGGHLPHEKHPPLSVDNAYRDREHFHPPPSPQRPPHQAAPTRLPSKLVVWLRLRAVSMSWRRPDFIPDGAV